MRYHCRHCGGWLGFTEEKLDSGRNFICACNKCGWKAVQFSSVYFETSMVISNKNILPPLIRR